MMFALARCSGWLAHWLAFHAGNAKEKRIWRPQSHYIGPHFNHFSEKYLFIRIGLRNYNLLCHLYILSPLSHPTMIQSRLIWELTANDYIFQHHFLN